MAAPVAIVAWRLSRAARPATHAVHVAESRVAELASEHGVLVPLVRAYGAEAYAAQQLRDAAKESEQAVMRALQLYRQDDAWRALVRRGMAQDFSWDHAARDYMALYRDLLPAELPQR